MYGGVLRGKHGKDKGDGKACGKGNKQSTQSHNVRGKEGNGRGKDGGKCEKGEKGKNFWGKKANRKGKGKGPTLDRASELIQHVQQRLRVTTMCLYPREECSCDGSILCCGGPDGLSGRPHGWRYNAHTGEWDESGSPEVERYLEAMSAMSAPRHLSPPPPPPPPPPPRSATATNAQAAQPESQSRAVRAANPVATAGESTDRADCADNVGAAATAPAAEPADALPAQPQQQPEHG